MGSHIIDGQFQSDKYPDTSRGLVPLKPTDPMAQDLLWEYAQRRREVDEEFADDLEEVLRNAGYRPRPKYASLKTLAEALRDGQEKQALCSFDKEFVRVTSEPNPGEPNGKNGRVLFCCAEEDFVDEAFEALRIMRTA